MNNNNEKVGEFFNFITERHKIWDRRYVQKLPPPWTNDPILQKREFCNVLRLLDKTTAWIYEGAICTSEGDPENLLWRLVFCRVINFIPTLERTGTPAHQEVSFKRLEDTFLRIKAEKRSPFGSAYRCPRNKKGQSQIETGIFMLREVHRNIGPLTERIWGAKTLREASQTISDFPNYGPFLAMQIVWDLLYSETFPFSETDQFPYLGDGAVDGVLALFPDIPSGKSKHSKELQEGQLKWLHEHQNKYLDGGIFHLTLWDVEACLCEWRKYINCRNGVGRSRPNFKPVSGEDLYGL